MKFPERLKNGPGEDGRLAREVIGEESFSDAPADAKERVWAGVSAALGPGAGGGGTPSGAPAVGRGAGVLTAAIIAGVVGLGGFGVAVWKLRDSKREERPAAAQAQPVLVAPAPGSASSQQPLAAEETPPETATRPSGPKRTVASISAPSEVAPPASEPASDAKTSALLAESALVARARSALRSGDVSSSRQLLAQLDKEFPRGALMQEREALAIELLWQSGQRQQASERARRFIQAYPSSVHTARLKTFVDPE